MTPFGSLRRYPGLPGEVFQEILNKHFLEGFFSNKKQ
jgi:hypothetical protein